MADDAVMEIFGEPESLDALADVLDAAMSDGAGVDWDEDVATEQGLVAAALEAVEDKGMLRLTLNETRRLFPETRTACRAVGLSYIVSSGPTGSEGYDQASYWKPGMAEEFSSMIDGIAPVFSLAEVKLAYSEGLSGVKTLIDRMDSLTLADVPKMLAVSDEVRPRLQEWHEALQQRRTRSGR